MKPPLILRCSLVMALTCAAAPGLMAHTMSLTFAEITVEDRVIRWVLRLPAPELDLLFGLDRNANGQVDLSEAMANEKTIRDYYLSRIGIRNDGRDLPAAAAPLRLWTDPDGHQFLETVVTFTGPEPKFGKLEARCDVLREVVSTHKTLAKVSRNGAIRELVFADGKPRDLLAETTVLAAVAQFLRLGIHHIFTGYDHIAFVLAVVLVGGSFRSIVKIVTSFTVAHSVTLALAAFQIVRLPSWLVESGIALSIMYIAMENIFFKEYNRRWMITFFFGLVHGFGFAGALAEAELPRNLLATSLFSFNLGVEIGQVAIVSLMLPALLYARKTEFHPKIVRFASAAIFIAGSFWFWERITGS